MESDERFPLLTLKLAKDEEQRSATNSTSQGLDLRAPFHACSALHAWFLIVRNSFFRWRVTAMRMQAWAAVSPARYAETGRGTLVDLDSDTRLPPISPLAVIVYPHALGIANKRLPAANGFFRVRPTHATNERAPRANDWIPARLRKGSHVFVRMPGEDFLRVGSYAGAFGEMCGHLVLSCGQPVLYAGELEVDDNSCLVRWSSRSGSYRPSAEAAGVAQLDLSLFIPYERSAPVDMPTFASASHTPELDARLYDPSNMQLRPHSLPAASADALGVFGLANREAPWAALEGRAAKPHAMMREDTPGSASAGPESGSAARGVGLAGGHPSLARSLTREMRSVMSKSERAAPTATADVLAGRSVPAAPIR